MAIGADLIAGFTTEDEAMFRNSLDLVAECGVAFLHVFPYSPRPGTPAARMPAVAPEIVRERAARLRAAGTAALDTELQARIGTVGDVLVEKPGLGRAGFYAAVDCPAGLVGLQRLRFTGVAGGRLIGEPVS
jgi:threonylcarbamoyladenosine tRNA methylthiotransferase MtaB